MLALRILLTAILGFIAPAAFAATYNFVATFDGTTATPDAGSDPVGGTALVEGDSYTMTLSASGDDYWSVDSEFVNVFVPMSFFVDESGTRTADITATFFLDGQQVEQIFDAGVEQAFVHVGAQTWTLATGLEFDSVVLSYDLLTSTTEFTTLSESSSLFAEFGSSSSSGFFGGLESVSYVAAVVPLPAGLPLILSALGALAFVARNRRLS